MESNSVAIPFPSASCSGRGLAVLAAILIPGASTNGQEAEAIASFPREKDPAILASKPDMDGPRSSWYSSKYNNSANPAGLHFDRLKRSTWLLTDLSHFSWPETPKSGLCGLR